MTQSLVIVLTGCASGIGQHLADVLAGQGHRLLATDINEAGLNDHAAARQWPAEQVLWRRLDVRDRAAWDDIIKLAVQTWGQVDVVMNIAGYLQPDNICDTSIDEIDRHIDINTKGMIYGTQAAAALMVRQRYGHIINIASIAGLIPAPSLSLYVASKFAIRGFTLSVAPELRSFGVAVSVVCPNVVKTPMVTNQINNKEAALLFINFKMLSVETIAEVIINKVMKKKPLETFIPGYVGPLAKLVTVIPGVSNLVMKPVAKLGRARQQSMSKRS